MEGVLEDIINHGSRREVGRPFSSPISLLLSASLFKITTPEYQTRAAQQPKIKTFLRLVELNKVSAILNAVGDTMV